MRSSYPLAVAACLLLLLHQHARCAPATSPDAPAMLDLARALEASNPGALSSWHLGNGPCSSKWKGVIECDASTLHVTHLDLSHQELRGPLPGRELAALKHLAFLELGNNKFNSSIPEEMYNLTQLKYLSLEKNALTGPLSDSVGALTLLQQLKLTGNKLSGVLPTALGKLLSLQILDAGYNGFNGAIPSSLGSLKNLTLLRLSSNALSGAIPPSLGGLLRLNVLDLYSNRLTGAIPPEIGGAKALISIAVDENHLTGSLPESLGTLRWLSAFYAVSNDLSGEIPGSFANLQHLAFLDLSYNPKLGGTIPSFFGKLLKLESLALVQCSFEGPIPEALGGLPRLQELYLDHNRLLGPIPPALGALPTLERLYLDHNRLQWRIPETLCDLAHVQEINLGSNELEGPIPACLAALPDLTSLNLASNKLTGSAPNSSSHPQLITSYDENCLTDAANQTPSCTQPLKPPAPPPRAASPPAEPVASARRSSHAGLLLLLGLLGGVGVVAAALLALYLRCGDHRFRFSSGTAVLPGRRKKKAGKGGVREFSFAAVKRATKGFTTEIGRGSFGTVYAGEGLLGADCSDLLALKRAVNVSKHSDFMFKCKVELLSRARHPNLVNLVGSCVSNGEQILAYEYISGCTLRERLQKQAGPVLSWEVRVRIAAEVALALEHLHHGCAPALIHRNVTSANVFLTDGGSAKLADFGLKKSHSEVDRATGYLDPQCEHTSMLTEKSDVYAFGVVLLELLTGQKAMKDVTLAQVAAPFLSDPQMLPLMVDSGLETVSPDELYVLGEVVRGCLLPERAERPSMRDVVAHMAEGGLLDPDCLGGAMGGAPTSDDPLSSLLAQDSPDSYHSSWSSDREPGRDLEDPIRSASGKQRDEMISALLPPRRQRR